METYILFAKNAFRQNVVYRTNTIIYSVMSMLSLFIQFNIWKTLYIGDKVIQNINLTEMLTYTVLSTLMSSFTSDKISGFLGAKIRSGEIGGDFIRPINLKLYLIANQVGNSAYDVAFNFIPVTIITVFFGSFALPSGILNGFAFLLSALLGIVLIYFIYYVVGLLSFWLKSAGYTHWTMIALTTLFSGSSIPLWFYPPVLRSIAEVLPFRFVSFEPISIYLGKASGSQILICVFMQIFWIIVIYFLGAFLWSKAKSRVLVQGG